MSITGITEDDIANYLANTPGFFDRHAALLATVQLTSPHGNRAVSLQERQMEMLRERIRGLERKIMEMIRHGQENVALADRLHRWTLSLLSTLDPLGVPEVLVQELREQFLIPQAGIRLWGVADAFLEMPFAQGCSADVRSFASSLDAPYVGANAAFEAAQWLDDPAGVASLAMVPLRAAPGQPAFGLLVLGSPDPTRYTADMGTDFLVQIGELASAGLARLLPEA
jgi:uncharacterized protein YigA (DUF484 family)